jgi:uncharacterized protein
VKLQKEKEISPETCLLLIFVKAPKKGTVKTRLANAIGEEHACALYRCFVEDLLEMVDKTMEKDSSTVKICFHPPQSEKDIVHWLGSGRGYWPQCGQDLGERMINAFRRGFAEGFTHIVLIGSDIPSLQGHIIRKGFARLKSQDAVIGPASDGGYYLLGFRSGTFHPEALQGISWSTAQVFSQTMRILTERKLRVSVLPPCSDIDTYEALKAWRGSEPGNHTETSKTGSYAVRHGLIDI